MNIELLASSHLKDEFDCGTKEFNDYLQQYAGKNSKKNIGRTYVAVEPGSKIVRGFYTICNASVGREELPESHLPHYPVPALLLAQLARDLSCRGAGLGEYLLMDALRVAEELNKTTAIYAVITDAWDSRARDFYLQNGFSEVRGSPLRLYLTMKKIRQLRLTDHP